MLPVDWTQFATGGSSRACGSCVLQNNRPIIPGRRLMRFLPGLYIPPNFLPAEEDEGGASAGGIRRGFLPATERPEIAISDCYLILLSIQ